MPVFHSSTARPLLFPETMAQVDRRTISGGTPGIELMERAGRAALRVLRGRWGPRSVKVLAGPGNNGGDGWVIARLLHEAGWPVSVYSDWPLDQLSGDAHLACAAAQLSARPLATADFSGATLVVDALFGAGLARAIEGGAAMVLTKAAESSGPVLAIDLPSGLSGRTGDVLGQSLKADATVTFGAAKPGHLLGEGRDLTGDLHVMDIGLDLQAEDADALWNGPDLWRDALPLPPQAAHKYARGGVLVVGGPRHQGGAARLTAHAAAVTGAGATTIAATPSAADVYAASLDAIMVRKFDDPTVLGNLFADTRIRAGVIGPALGTDRKAAAQLEAALESRKPLVLDADALTLLARRQEPFKGIPTGSVLTPHEGEFQRLFPEISGSALERALLASTQSAHTVLLKGAATVIAAPGCTPIISTHSTPWLATAGSGDVLSGIIGALLAQGVQAQLAASVGAWIHGESGRKGSVGLTADSLWRQIPAVLHAIGAITDD